VLILNGPLAIRDLFSSTLLESISDVSVISGPAVNWYFWLSRNSLNQEENSQSPMKMLNSRQDINAKITSENVLLLSE
jgi:hypothetical protein